MNFLGVDSHRYERVVLEARFVEKRCDRWEGHLTQRSNFGK